MNKLFSAMLIILPLSLIACGDGQQNAVPPAPEVDVMKTLKQSITVWDEYTGRFSATESVELRSRVTGYLMEKRFIDGALVKKGSVLFIIDPRPFEFELKRAKAQYNLAVKEYKRAKNLLESRAISQEDFDRRAQEFKVSEANLDEAKMNLDFTQIKAPADGRVSDSTIDIGNLVTANTTVLTSVVSLNPIHFEFEMSQADFLRYMRLDRSGKRPRGDTSPNPIFVKLHDEEQFTHLGYTDFIDNQVSKGTGTIRTRALIENNDLMIYPGLFGRARLIGAQNMEYCLVPEQALNTDQDRKFVYTVNAENKVHRAYVKVGRLLDNGFVIIDTGLNGDEMIVVSGLQRIRMPEQLVTPKIVEAKWIESDKLPDLSALNLSNTLNDLMKKRTSEFKGE